MPWRGLQILRVQEIKRKRKRTVKSKEKNKERKKEMRTERKTTAENSNCESLLIAFFPLL